MKTIIASLIVMFAAQAYAQDPPSQPNFFPHGKVCKFNCSLTVPPSTDVPPSLLESTRAQPAQPTITMSMRIPNQDRMDETPRVLRVILDDDTEYAVPYTYQNVNAGKVVFQKNGFSIVIKPAEPLNYTAVNFRQP